MRKTQIIAPAWANTKSIRSWQATYTVLSVDNVRVIAIESRSAIDVVVARICSHSTILGTHSRYYVSSPNFGIAIPCIGSLAETNWITERLIGLGMRKYKFYHDSVIIEKQKSLIPQKEAALEKIATEKGLNNTDCGCIIEISDDERLLAHLQLKSQTSLKAIHVFSDEEIQRIKNTIANGYRKPFRSRSGNEVLSGLYFPKQGSFFLFMLNSGIRAGEAVALKYSDFDFKNRTVRIHETAVNTKIRNADGTATGKRNRSFTTPKTERSDALLHLNPEAIQIILDMKALEPRSYDGYVVHSDYKPLAEKSLYQRFGKLLSGAGVQPCGLHSLRHTHGTRLYEATRDLKFVCQQLRHSDPSFTAKTYVHQSDKRTREILATFKI